MEKMFQAYKDVAEFRLVYINEAHAADSNWAAPYAKEKGIFDHKSFEDRCATADMLIKDEDLTIATVIDEMDNKVNKAYSAWPDRVFLVRTDGRLAVAAGRGPFGYKPGIKAANKWLTEFKKTGVEPELPVITDEKKKDTGESATTQPTRTSGADDDDS